MLVRKELLPADYEYVMVFRHGDDITCLPAAPPWTGGKHSMLRILWKIVLFSSHFL